MYERGLNFVEIDLYKSDAEKFIVTEKGLLPPLCTIEGLGESVAQNIVEERKNGFKHKFVFVYNILKQIFLRYKTHLICIRNSSQNIILF